MIRMMSTFGIWWLRLERWIQQQSLALVVVLVAILGGLALLAPVEHQQEVLAPTDDSAKTYFGGPNSVGQTFAPLPGLRQIRLRIGRQEDAKGPLILHLRTEYFGEDVRSAAVFVPEPETENVTFQFDPIHRVNGQLFWVLEAPHGPRQGYWTYREQDESAFPQGEALIAGRHLRGNFAFTQVGAKPGYQNLSGNFGFTQVGAQTGYEELGPRLLESIQSWEWQSVVIFVVTASLFVLFRPKLMQYALSTRGCVIMLMLITLVLHVFRSHTAPVIIDEGAYLQDAVQTTITFLPFRDFLTKGPVYVALLKVWRELAPDVLEGWRLLSAFSWVGVVGLTAALARRFGLPGNIQVTSAALIAVLPGVVSASTPLLLQVVSTLFAVWAIVVLLKGAQEDRWRLVALGALLLVVGYLTRSSTIAAGITGAVLLLLFARRRWQALGVYIATGAAAIAVVSGLALLVMSPEKVAVMLNIEAVTVGQLRTAQAGGVEPVIRWVTEAATVLWRAGGWILTGIVWLPLLLLSRIKGMGKVLGVGLWMAIVGMSLYHLIDLDYALPKALLITRVTMLAIVFGIPALWLLVTLQSREEKYEAYGGWKWIAVCVVWLAALVLLYRSWGAFRSSYIVEFLPPVVILAAVGLAYGIPQLFKRPLAQAALVGLFAASWWQGVGVDTNYPSSGTMVAEAVQEMARVVQKEVPPSEEILTAQPVVTAAAKRKIIRGYSHPGWVRAARLGGVPQELRKIYFAEDEEITRWLQDEVRFVVTDERTSEIYFDDFPERQKILREQFELIGEVPNDLTEEPFRLYRRR